MPNSVEIDGVSLEIPRHVHRDGGVGQGGASRIVETVDELHAAVADGWVIDPNAPVDAPIVDDVPPVAADVPAPRRPGRPPKPKP